MSDHRGRESQFAYNVGYADKFGTKDFDPALFGAADFFLVEAFLLARPSAEIAVIGAMETAKGKTRIVVNLQHIPSWKNYTRQAQAIIELADIIIGNDNEQNLFRQVMDAPGLPQQMIVTTMAERGAELRMGAKRFSVAAYPCRIANGIGAGDAFAAGFLLGLSKGWDANESLNAGARAASAILEEISARPTKSLSHL